MLVSIGGYLLLTDGVKMVGVDEGNFSNHWEINLDFKKSNPYSYDFAAANDLLNVKI